MSDHQYKRLTKKRMSETAKAVKLSLKAGAKELLYQGDRPVEDMELAQKIAMDITAASGAVQVKDTYVQIAFDLMDHCRTGDSNGKKMSKKAIRDRAHEMCVTIKDKQEGVPKEKKEKGKMIEKKVQASAGAVGILSGFDVTTAEHLMDLAMEVMQAAGRSTIQERDVRPLADNVDKCAPSEEAAEETAEEVVEEVKAAPKKRKKAARRKAKK